MFVPAETRPGERRVALTPDSAKKLQPTGIQLGIQSGAGELAGITDAEYAEAGVSVVGPEFVDAALQAASVVASVRPLTPEQVAQCAPGSVLLSFLDPSADRETVDAAAEAGVTALSFNLIPRISRAQSMDALTSQALVAGYRAALVAADRLRRFFPLSMTAAGTVQPAKVLVLGAGVAGLQAIATAKRLGAVVSAYDVRAASADEVRSVGATFINLDLDVIEGAGGYAREMTEDRAARQQELLAPHIAEADALITTAAIPGRQAPRLVTSAMLAGMRPGSVAVDLAAETGGNVEGSVPGEEVEIDGVLVWGGQDVPSEMPLDASRLYSMNVAAVLRLINADGELNVDPEDEIIEGSAVVLDGQIAERWVEGS